MKLKLQILFLLFFVSFSLLGQNKTLIIKGEVRHWQSKMPIADVMITPLSGNQFTISDSKGRFILELPESPRVQLYFRHPSYHAFVKEIQAGDTVELSVELKEKTRLLDSVAVYALQKPETLVGKPQYSIYDFDFYEDKFILLTAERSLEKASLRLADEKGNIISSLSLPRAAGTASCFFHDYEGYTDLICSDTILRLDLMQKDFLLMPIGKTFFERGIKPVADTANGSVYFSDQWDKFPLFNYYFSRNFDTASVLLKTVTNEALMKIYNMEYYYLPSSAQLQARRLAIQYRVDKRIIAAMMSGFTESMYYEPLYAPLFEFNDTVCIFNHYTDHIYHFDKKNRLIDSVPINYHHSKNWREWKKQLFADKFSNKVYAFFSKDGHHYLKQINHQTGKEVKTYKLKHHSAEKIKIRDGYVYYVYRPFNSTQERFLYRERME